MPTVVRQNEGTSTLHDHLPIMCVFSLGSTRCENDVINPSKVKPLSDDVRYFRWDHAQLCQYYEQTRVLLDPIYAELGVCDNLTDDCDVGALRDKIEQESRAAARKPRDAASVLFC